MHSIFTNVDVLYSILIQLSGDVRSEEFTSTAKSQRSILHLGLANKHLLEAALDRLWYSMGSLVPLVSILPTVAPAKETKSRSITLTGLIRDSHLCRLSYYASRIRYLKSVGKPLPPTLHPILSNVLPNSLLPNLQGFHCVFHSDTSFSEIACILGSPQIKTFIATSEKNLTASMGASLGAETIFLLAQLQGAHLTSMNIPSCIPYVNYLTEFRSLTTFSSENFLVSSELTSLSKLSKLRKLNIVLGGPSHEISSEPGPKLPREIFPSLSDFSIKGSLGAVHTFLQRIGSPSISRLHINVVDQDTSGVWSSIFYLIQRRWIYTLKDLHPTANNGTKLPFAILGTHDNVDLDFLGLSGWAEVGPEVLRQLCIPFRNLKGLHISCANNGLLGWDALVVIHECLPTLESLSIYLDRSSATGLSYSTLTPHHHPLKRLSVGFYREKSTPTTTTEQITIAHCLHMLFPHVEISSNPDGLAFVEGIQSLLAAFQRIRGDERKRWHREETTFQPIPKLTILNTAIRT